ncbi:glycosyltransferase family 4 protein [Escherichia albertii]|uniref:glycosyltransferase family 4 protein n=1 Tax=Escherichia albertii TaxID=208962 RepID=UPI0030C9BABC
MRILHVIPQIKSGGAEIAAMSAINYMNCQHDFKLIAIEPSHDNLFLDNVIYLRSSVYNPLTIFKLLNVIIREKPELVIFSLWKSSFLGLMLLPYLRLRNIKSLIIIHNARYAHVIDRIITKKAVKSFDEIFFDSESSREFTFPEGSSKGSVISFILRRPPRKSFFPSNEKIKFVFVGRVSKVKNINAAIKFVKVFNELNLGKKILFHIYGPDEGDMQNCKDIVKENNLSSVVYFMGKIKSEDVPAVLKKYDFYLQFSKMEGMAMSVVEAMQVGLIPCVTNVGQIEKYAKHLENSIIFDINKLDDVKYLAQMAKIIYSVATDFHHFHKLSSSAANTFNNTPIYAEDLERNILRILHK